ncbi:hypothetical protein SAMN05192529_10814 [Arachidicoccus rhizosphaerae]|uniref:Lipoprotein n=1 Tax=Arachidicoccus rhizosphaerae TaxID=551991 RepID=A0A1H3YD70_9BACT|nr:hypothetical protein [Arachidicoccus rhizosphaerae]SEA09535.1 hypothetical protein SAMN05192529_10814 [Arachidicoccus rhizosphaerae]
MTIISVKHTLPLLSILSYLSFLTLTFTGCKNKKPPEFNYQLSLQMQESITRNNRTLSFYFYSDSFKEKAGFKLEAKLVKNKKRISIKLFNLPKSPPSITPLETTVRLDNLTKG